MSVRLRALLGAFVAACLMLTPGASPANAVPGDSGTYVSGGTAAARANGQPVADEGTVVCDGGNDVGVGGLCLAFGGGDAVRVTDKLAGENVAYQICLDNNGDGICTSPDNSGFCADQVYFSHDDAGTFYNPVGPLPTGFATGCSGGPWKGYVVMLCEGAHAVGANAHVHPSGQGKAEVTVGGEGFGTFCGGWGPAPSRKPYKVGSGARYTSGGTAAARANGQPIVDEGAMVCNNGDNVGVGGFCVSFGGGDAVAVYDDALGMDVAFQVCVDNNADGVCTSPDNSLNCPDQIFFSHDDNGAFYNPVGPLPTDFATGCGLGAPWQGYVVFLCEGAHVSGLGAHAHPATAGNGRVTTGGEGLGTFCGGSYAEPSRKRYAPPRFTIDGNDPCRLVAAGDLFAEKGRMSGTLNVGPLTAAERGGAPGATMTVTCSVTVNGAPQGSATVSASGTGAVAGSSAVSFTGGGDDVVAVCADIQITGGPDTSQCEKTTTLVSLSDSVFGDLADAAETVAHEVADTVGCPFLTDLAGTYGPVVVGSHGDVFVNGQPVLDCPPYDLGIPPVSDAANGVFVLVSGL